MPWEGLNDFDSWVQKQSAATDNAVKESVAKAAALVVKTAQNNFQGTRHRVGHSIIPRQHVGGDKPNVISGFLRRSIIMQPIVREGHSAYSTSVGPTAIYARAIELGLRQAPSIKFPFFSPAAVEAGKQFPTIVREAFEKYTK